uniref:Tyrosinase copper-binding domain-containing protein n=1 Tax=Arundo donax TaxID=35708 RepID=A0A0A9H6D8_ARUDO
MASGSFSSGLIATSATSAPPACPSMLSANKRTVTPRRRCSSLSCRAGAGDIRLDRRDVLAGLTGIAAGGLGAYPYLAIAAAEKADTDNNLGLCSRGDEVRDTELKCQPGGAEPCPLPSPTVVDFTPPSGPMRFRQPAHRADPSLVDKYRLAVEKMKALPDSDPRSFASQAAIHQAYCDGYYRYDPSRTADAPFDVHFSWIFAPWHRMYMYFYERILGSLIGDDTFALPYWNWDAPAGMGLPAIFKDPFVNDQRANTLYDPNRNPAHVDAFVVLDYSKDENCPPIPFDPRPVPPEQYNRIVKDNLCTLYNQMIRQGRGARCFLGEKFCTRYPDTQKAGTAGKLESMAHTAVHIWTGDPASCLTGHDGKSHCNADMGFLGASGRDPVFYSHHANVDRLWHLWTTELGGKSFEDPEWLDTSFVFYDEKPQLVRIKVRDVLDPAALRYRYEEREPLEWRSSRPTVRQAPAAARSLVPSTPVFPVTLTEGRNVEVPNVARPRREKGKLEVLVFDSIEFNPAEHAKFDVAINVPPELAGGVGPQWVEYAGSFASLPRHSSTTRMEARLELPVEDVLDDMEVGEGVPVNVVLVPRTPGITIKTQPKIVVTDC